MFKTYLAPVMITICKLHQSQIVLYCVKPSVTDFIKSEFTTVRLALKTSTFEILYGDQFTLTPWIDPRGGGGASQ